MNTARMLAEKLGGRVDLQYDVLTVKHMRISPIVVVELNNLTEATALAKENQGEVKLIVNQSNQVVAIIVVIKIR